MPCRGVVSRVGLQVAAVVDERGLRDPGPAAEGKWAVLVGGWQAGNELQERRSGEGQVSGAVLLLWEVEFESQCVLWGSAGIGSW